MFHVGLIIVFLHLSCKPGVGGITSPYGWDLQISLEGLWSFKTHPIDDQEQGFREKWWLHKFEGDVTEMPVPSSYNDISSSGNLRDYLGWVWYQTMDPVDLSSWKEYRKVISFGGVHYYAVVWFGDLHVGSHEGGHVPFEFELPEGDRGYITVAVNNTLTNHTIPQGFVQHHSGKLSSPPFLTYHHDFDYFDYAGINRNVFIYATSKDFFVKDIILRTSVGPSLTRGYVEYTVVTGCAQCSTEPSCHVEIKNDTYLSVKNECASSFVLDTPTLWWNIFSVYGPPGYLYTFSVKIMNSESKNGGNIYKSQIGIRDISWSNESMLLNHKPVYLKGFGKHEDSNIRGRGFDWTVTMRDLELLKWSQANVIRTTHYPPSLELVQMANRRGLLLVVESPACSLSNFDATILQRHKDVMAEIFGAYGNNPSVIMWSLANEPVSSKPEADLYFKELSLLMHSVDTRPVTFVTAQQPSADRGIRHVDVICLNRYNGWYSYPGQLELIAGLLTEEVMQWRDSYNLPLIMTEYGAGSLPGLHSLPSSMWSEEYQTELLKAHFAAFDELKASKLLAGEMMWVFADFATPQEYIRPGGCMKGVFTRERVPKKAAFTIRERYSSLDSICSASQEQTVQHLPHIHADGGEEVLLV